MLRILADNPDNALALNDFALLAHRLHRCSNLHDIRSFLLYSIHHYHIQKSIVHLQPFQTPLQYSTVIFQEQAKVVRNQKKAVRQLRTAFPKRLKKTTDKIDRPFLKRVARKSAVHRHYLSRQIMRPFVRS